MLAVSVFRTCRPARGLALVGKFGVLILLAYVVIGIFGLDALGFVMGLSMTVLALLIVGFRFSTCFAAEEREIEV